jgi:hypothetical protein
MDTTIQDLHLNEIVRPYIRYISSTSFLVGKESKSVDLSSTEVSFIISIRIQYLYFVLVKMQTKVPFFSLILRIVAYVTVIYFLLSTLNSSYIHDTQFS